MRILAVTSGRPAREGGSDGADASIIPTILDANTNAATVMVAEEGAELVNASWWETLAAGRGVNLP